MMEFQLLRKTVRSTPAVIAAILLYFFMIISPINANKVDKDMDDYVSTAASLVSKHLIERTKKITNYHKIKEDLELLESNKQTTKQQLNGRDIIRQFKSNIEEIFKDKTEALKNIKRKAEEAKAQHEDKEKIAIFKYPNIHDVEKEDIYNSSLNIYPTFSPKVRVSMERSFVQIPTNIFANSSQVLNTVKWTSNLDDAFKANYYNQSNGTLLFQYYGDKSGLMRLYPGSKFGTEGDKVDLFDCRRRVWYIQASASPKDIVIIIDVSGSMKGSNIGIARIAAGSLIDTLSENDYFNVLTINDKVRYVKPCAKHLIQATKLNKEAMKLALQDLGKTESIAKSELAIEEAFKILGPNSENRTTADCNQAIMFISDGIEGENVAPDIFKKYNANKTVRAFAFFVGRTHVNVGKKALLKMSCDNRGYFYPVESVGNIWDKVLEYLKVMSRPLNITRNNHPVTYTPMYMDSGGMGMIMTISMSVFDQNGFIGVTGTDITLRSLLEKIPVSTFGPFSHIFVINNNGFVVIHPKLKDQKGYLVAHRNVFLEDLVRGVSDNKSAELKRSMVDQSRNGEMSFPLFWLYDDDRKCAHVQAKVFYEPIDDTEFSAGVVLADNEVSYSQYTDEAANDWLRQGIDALEAPASGGRHGYHGISIARWDYCEKPGDNMTPKNVKRFYTATELKTYLNGFKNGKISNVPRNCDRDLLKQLLVTSGIVNRRVNESWNPKLLDDKLYDGVFVSTNGGYAKYYSSNASRYPREFRKPPHFDAAAAVPNATISVMAPYVYSDYDSGSSYFTVLAAVKVGDDQSLTAVSGVRIHRSFFRDILRDAASKGYCNSSDTNTHICALIDHNGYIIASNQGERYAGRFIGEISSILIEKLADAGVFKHTTLEDTQAECDHIEAEKSSSVNLLTPLKLLFQAAQGMVAVTQTLSWIAFQYSSFLISPITGDAPKPPKQRENKAPIKVSCTKKMPFYVFQPNVDRPKWVSCAKPGCNIVYVMKEVDGSNLLFLYASSIQQCRSNCFRPRQNLRYTQNATDVENSVCKVDNRYRRQPNGCYNEQVADENIKCGRAGLIKPSVWISVMLGWMYYFITLV